MVIKCDSLNLAAHGAEPAKNGSDSRPGAKTYIGCALLALFVLVSGCASKSSKLTKGKHIPRNVASISLDCNVRPLFSERVFDVAWNARLCTELTSQLARQARADRLSRRTPNAATVALGSAYLFQDASTRPMKEKAWAAKNHRNLVDDLPLLMSSRYESEFNSVVAALNRDLADRGKPVVDDDLPAVLWGRAFETGRKDLHLHVALSGFYDAPDGTTQNIKMSATLRDEAGCVHGRGGWLFDFTPEALRSATDVIDLIAAQLRPSLLSATDDYRRWLDGGYGKQRCRT